MLHLNFRDLQGGPVETIGTLDATDPVFVGLGLQFTGPVEVAGAIRQTGEGDFLWRGHIHGTLGGECRRCLAAVSVEVDDDVDMLFSADPELIEDPSVYPVDPAADQLDVSSAIREEIALRVSTFPLCRPDCKGLCASCGADLNAGACACAPTGSTN
ncbi:MAG: DUF177 domain-containing protein [Acetobacteraceae bacterium]